MKTTSPLVSIAWQNSLVTSGDRDGNIALWDINTGKGFMKVKGHNSPVHKIDLWSDAADCNLVVTSGVGTITIIDMRSNSPVFSEGVHSRAINLCKVNESNMLVTGSADQTVKILDAYMGFQVRGEMRATGEILCGTMAHNKVAVGCSDGNLLVYDTDIQDCIFGFGAERAGGISCVALTPDNKKLITGGESGTPLLISFV